MKLADYAHVRPAVDPMSGLPKGLAFECADQNEGGVRAHWPVTSDSFLVLICSARAASCESFPVPICSG